MRRAWIDAEETVSVLQQCVLAGVCRSTIYAQQKPPVIDERDLLHSRLIDEEYTRHPFYGSRRMVVFLKTVGHTVEPLAKLTRCHLLRRSIRSPGAIFVASEACPAERLT